MTRQFFCHQLTDFSIFKGKNHFLCYRAKEMLSVYLYSIERKIWIWGGCHSLIVTQFVCQDFSSLFPFLSFFTKQIFLLTSLFLCKKQVKNVDNVDNFVNNSIFPPFLNPQNVDNYSHLSLIFDIYTNINSFVCAICTIYPLSIIFFENKLSFLSTNCLTIHHSYPH